MLSPGRSRRLISTGRLVRGLWLALLGLVVVTFAAGLAVWFPRIQVVCLDVPLVCQQQMYTSAADAQSLQASGWSLAAYAWWATVTRGVFKLLGVALGVLVFWRRPDSRMALVASLFLILGLETSVYNALAIVVPAWLLPTRLVAFAGLVCFALFFYLFPSGEFVPRWTRWAALAWGVLFGLSTFFPDSMLNFNNWPLPAFIGLVLPFIASLAGSQVYRYRAVSGPAERLQTRWVVFATAITLILFVLSMARISLGRGMVFGRGWILTDLGLQQTAVVIPLAIGIAILRHQLWGIDIIIRRTLIYSALTVVLGLAYLGSVLVLQPVLARLTGQGTELANVLSTLAIAALFGPARRRVQAAIDRRFYRKKYDAARTLAGFGAQARDEVALEQLTGQLLAVVEATMRPAHASLWVRKRGTHPLNPLWGAGGAGGNREMTPEKGQVEVGDSRDAFQAGDRV